MTGPTTTGPTTTTTGPPTPAQAVLAAVRKRFFGAADVDRYGDVRTDAVIVSWFGVSSLAVSLAGHVVLLDTYLTHFDQDRCSGSDPRAPAGYVPATYDDLAALRPEAIFVGHEHTDHECRTGELLVRTGATLVGLPQACTKARAEADAYAGRSVAIDCVPTLPADSTFGSSATIGPLGPSVGITVVRNLHSGPATDAAHDSGGAEALLFRFQVGTFSFEWNDSDGPLRERAPALLQTLQQLPATDVVFGASVGLDLAEHGFRDAIDYPQALRAQQYFPLHQDIDSVAGSSRAFEPGVAHEIAARPGLALALHWLQDPTDYLRPFVFPLTS